MNAQPEKGSMAYLTLLSLVAALGGLLFGYDTAVISGATGYMEAYFKLDPAMTGWAAASALLGCVIGVALAGDLADRMGRRGALRVAAWLFLISAVGSAVPQSLGVFVFFRVVGGLGVGIASMTSPMYIAEVSPARIRGRMVSLNQFAIITGMLVVYFVNYKISQHGDAAWKVENAWRWMFGSEAVPCVIFLGLLFLVPETPRWLVQRGRSAEAQEVLAKIEGEVYAAKEMPEIEQSIRSDKALLGGYSFSGPLRLAGGISLGLVVLLHIISTAGFSKWATEAFKVTAETARAYGVYVAMAGFVVLCAWLVRRGLRECAERGLRKAMVIGIFLAVLQQVTGINVFLYYAPKILEGISKAGTDVAMLQTILVGGVNLLFTIVAIWIVDRAGRKPLMIIGSVGMGVCLTLIGVAAMTDAIGAWLLAAMLGYIACFALAVGPVTWVILSEIFPTRMRGRAMAIATFCLWVANFIVSQTFPMMDKSEFLVKKFNHGFPFFIYAAFCVVLVLVVVRMVPETKGRSLEDIERMWKEKHG